MEPQETTDVEMVEDTVFQLKENMFMELDQLLWYATNKRSLMSDRTLGMTNDRQLMHELLQMIQFKLKIISALRDQVITEESRQGIW